MPPHPGLVCAARASKVPREVWLPGQQDLSDTLCLLAAKH